MGRVLAAAGELASSMHSTSDESLRVATLGSATGVHVGRVPGGGGHTSERNGSTGHI